MGNLISRKVLLHLSAVGAVKNMWVVNLVQSLPVVKLDGCDVHLDG